ncbi:hypothetical protein [Bradyrhizobium sp. G127]|uniref:hypothetical protein n=1 Tax=Bradyrhizobium sp. G127 TaxID=2904800 RepID=UPI001F40022A|nr:hypothetical protein [Bradyrhizobium sp. G127]MCF2523843.1 hypothetical protein [Bradyrhizobium sp. G127]
MRIASSSVGNHAAESIPAACHADNILQQSERAFNGAAGVAGFEMTPHPVEFVVSENIENRRGPDGAKRVLAGGHSGFRGASE